MLDSITKAHHINLPVQEFTRSQAQRVRAELIYAGYMPADTYCTSIVLSDGTAVWRITEPQAYDYNESPIVGRITPEQFINGAATPEGVQRERQLSGADRHPRFNSSLAGRA